MSLSQELETGKDIPRNQVYLPSESKRRLFDRDFTLREVVCDSCKTVLCALLIPEEHEADLVWPFDVTCGIHSHLLVPKGTAGAAKVFCHGTAIQEWAAKNYLKKYL